MFAARADQASFVAFLFLVSAVVVAVVVSCPFFHVGKCALLALCWSIGMVWWWLRDGRYRFCFYNR